MKNVFKLALCLVTMSSMLFSTLSNAGLPVIRGIGGEFTLNSTLGHPVSLSDYQGKTVILTFGYTNCPDVCPVTLGYLTALMRNLGEQKSQVQVLFVSVDPKYDTIEHLDKYLIYFDQSIVGLTGTQQEVDIVADSFKLRRASVADLEVSTEYRKKKFSKDGVNKAEDKTKIFSHSTYIYLLDKQGRTRTFFDTGTSRDKVKQQIASLLAE